MALGTINWDGVADSEVLNKGVYQARFASWKEKETSTGKVMVAVRWVVEQPEMYANKAVFENFVIGGEDAGSIDPSSFGMRELKKSAKMLRVQLDPDLETTLNKMLEVSCVLQVEQETYQDRLQNKITGRYALGDREPSVSGPIGSTPTAVTPLAGRPTGRRAAH